MNHRKHAATAPSRRNAGAARWVGLLRGGGSGAPSLRLVALALLAATCLLGLAASPAFAARGHEYEPGVVIGEPCTAIPCGGGELTEPSGVAVNESSGDIYVVDEGNSRVQVFDPAGNFLFLFGGEVNKTKAEEPASSEAERNLCTAASGDVCQPGTVGIAPGQFKAPVGIAIDNAPGSPSHGDVYVADNLREGPGTNVVDKFDSAGGYLNRLSGLTALGGVAVDPTGTLWLDTEGEAVLGYTSAVENQPLAGPAAERGISPPLGGFSFNANNFAVDSSEGFYVRNSDGVEARIAKVRPNPNEEVHNLVVQNKELDEEDSSAVAVERTSDVAFLDNLTSVAAFSPEGVELERFDFDGDLTEGAGIGIDATSGFAYVADSAKGHLLVLAPSQPGAPSVETGNQFVSDVTSVGAELHSEVNPRSEEGEGPTTYRFQYGSCPSLSACATSPYGFSTPVATLAPDFQAHPVSAVLSGLALGTAYHYRVVAENSLSTEPTLGPESTFTTQTAESLSLPDARQWELVSPPNKHGAQIESIAEIGVVQAAAQGGAITYLAKTPSDFEPQGYTNEEQILSTRSSSGWSSRNIGIPHSSTTGKALTQGTEYKLFSAELSLSAVQPFGEFNPQLSLEASESTAYLHDLSLSCGPACFHPLVTGKPGFENVPVGTVFGEEAECEPAVGHRSIITCGPAVLGATEDLNHLVLSARAPLTPGADPLGGLYEWSGGTLLPVSVLPGEEFVTGGGSLGLGNQATRGAISSDGQRIAWTRNETLFERDTTHAETVQVDAAEAGCGVCESGGGRFQIASADGSRVFFTDTHRLTEDSGAKQSNENGNEPRADLYECLIIAASEGMSCDLSDLTPKRGEEDADVQGSVLGASEDGSRIYFVAKGVLSQVPNAEGQEPISGQPNLYLRDGADTEFIATLSAGDAHNWLEELETQPTRVSANGRFVALMSQARLTDYDNRDRTNGQPVAEVYLYDAQTRHLACASCEPTGARPLGYEYHNDLLSSGGRDVWRTHALIGANVTGWTQFGIGPPKSRHQPRYLSNSGRIFFNSAGALVPQDSNGTQDVYEFEPAGVGGCTETLPTYSQHNGGCVSLISSGASREESAFLDASESGDDVFFLTSSRLNPQDVDNARDVYDAHVCSAASPCLPSPPAPAPACEGDACQQPATPPDFESPGTALLNGPENVLECPKGKVKKSGKCVAKKHKSKQHKKKAHGKKSHRAASHNRGGHK